MRNKRRWLLPEAIEDILPQDAARIEALRRRILDEFRLHGYQLVAPPLLEYLDSLLTGSGRDMELRTFKLVDQISGRTLGIRADIAPQVARIDAHLLNRKGVSRLCYCASVLHTLPAGLMATREPLQIGAEIYGHAGIEADIEIIRLLASSLRLAGLPTSRIDLGHVGVFRALIAQAGFDAERVEELFSALQTKDVPALHEITQELAPAVRDALRLLPECYGGVDALERLAAVAVGNAEVAAALGELRQLAQALRDLPISFDLADLRGYHYHSGVVFAAYSVRHPNAIALGGRYDKVGQAFGRGRAATGFSIDMRELILLAPESVMRGAILAPCLDDGELNAKIESLREQGEVVLLALPGHAGQWAEAGCDRQLVRRGDRWLIEGLKEE